MSARAARTRAVLCMGQHCNAGGRAESLCARLRAHLGEPLPAFMARDRAISWQTATCLDDCDNGPNLVIDPPGIRVQHLTLAALDDVIAAHLSDPAAL